MTKELSIKMHMYMEYEGEKTEEELKNEFQDLIFKFAKENDLDYQIHETELQEV